MNRSRTLFAAFSIVLTFLILSACGGGSADPTNPTPGPTPTPSPAPVATPTPAPSSSFVCPLPPSSKTNPNDCYIGKPFLSAQINSAIDTVIASKPGLFNLAETNGGNPRVLDRDGYWAAVKRELEKQGVCVVIEKEEFAVKNTNEYNEQWNLWTSAGFVRRRYVTSCSPAWF